VDDSDLAGSLGHPMRLLVLCYELPPVGGGTGVACSQVLRLLSLRQDLRIEVISSSPSPEAQRYTSGNMTVHLLPVGKRQLSFWQPDELLRWMVGAARLARKLAREAPFDLCHCWSGLPSGIVGWWLRDRQPYLVSLRGSDVPGYNRRLRWLDPLLLRHLARRVWGHSAGVFAVSPTLRSMAQATAPELTIGVLPNGVDGDFFQPRQNLGRASFVFAGRLIERKGVDTLFQAVRIVATRHPQLRLTVAGDGPEREALLTLRETLGIGAQVSLVGRLDREQLARTLGDAGVIVLPAVTDAMPNVVLEGMAAGMAVIATDTSASSIVDDNGQLVPARDPGALAAAIERYLDDPELLAAHQRRSRELALQRSWDKVAQDHVVRFQRAMLALPAGAAAPTAPTRLRRLGRKQVH
jgi:glycosyltransferase involved in cell wall biosynthesis